jgi:hypothetical protein
MTTDEKIRLIADLRDAGRALGRILDGGHKPEATQLLRDDCCDALASLSMTEIRLVGEVGTDNL